MKSRRNRLFALILAAILVVGGIAPAYADNGLSVTVTPPLIQLSIGPGDNWTSTLKIVNNNDFDVTYYAQVMDMQAEGEDGRSKFIPLVNEDQADPTLQSFALARWITLSPDPITVKAGASGNVPFTVTIPPNAEPGGHYAAILIGTQPGSVTGKGTAMRVASYVSSLIFVEIKGDAQESGRIREFSTSKALYQTPDVDFTVRFENTGNTHVHPQGNVTIYNMWGKERGEVTINNQDKDFGNVLPKSIRRFQFSWSGEQSLFDIGPYSAVVTLDYGADGKKNVTATTYFWVVPVVPVSIGVGCVLLFVILITWLIRRYIRRALMLEKVRLGVPASMPLADARAPVIETLIEPLREGVIDLRSMGAAKQPVIAPVAGPADSHAQSPVRPRLEAVRSSLTLMQFIAKYKLFFVFIVVCIALGFSAWWYFAKVLQAKRGYQISNVTIQSEPVSPQ